MNGKCLLTLLWQHLCKFICSCFATNCDTVYLIAQARKGNKPGTHFLVKERVIELSYFPQFCHLVFLLLKKGAIEPVKAQSRSFLRAISCFLHFWPHCSTPLTYGVIKVQLMTFVLSLFSASVYLFIEDIAILNLVFQV